MIYTLTLSPSVDLLIEGEKIQLNEVNRFEKFSILPGGKGINASVVLKRHNFENKAITFFDETSFSQFKQLFQKENIDILNINCSKKTRVNVKFYGQDNNFELNGPKTQISDLLFKKLIKELEKINSNDLLFIMGTSDDNLIFKILDFLKFKNINFIIDIDSPNLKDFISYQPFLIKPNKDELERNFNLKIESEKELIAALKKIKEIGAKNIIVSLDKNGSYLLDENNNIYKAEIIKPISVVSATGAGDTMISMFASHYFNNKNSAEALKIASAAAMGTVSSQWVTTKELTDKFLDNVKITKIL